MEASAGSRVAGTNTGSAWLRACPWACGAVFFALYALTLSPGAYPGESARLVAAALGYDIVLSPAHPIWRALVALWRLLPSPAAPVAHLNLLSALCGAAAAGLACRSLTRWIRPLLKDGVNSKQEVVSPRQADAVAALAGAAGAAALGGSAAVWGVSTHLHPLAFDLLLLVLGLDLLRAYRAHGAIWRGYALALLCGAGAAETPLLLVAAPALAAFLLVALLRQVKIPVRHLFGLAAAGLLGAGLSWLAAWQFLRAQEGGLRESVAVQSLALQFWREQLHQAAAYAPASGWFFTALLVAVWLLVLIFARRGFESVERPAALVSFTLVGALALLVLHEAPFLPWRALVLEGRVPVFEALLAAVLAGYAAAGLALCLLTARGNLEYERYRGSSGERWLPHAVLGAAFLAAVLALGVRNAGRAGGRRGAFADACARVLLEQLGPRRWLVSDGLLDAHLRVCAGCDGRELNLLDLTADPGPQRLASLRRALDADADLRPYRVALRNAASLGAASFAREWLRADPLAGSRLALAAIPQLWSESGWLPRPEGLFFSGATNRAALAGLDLPAENGRLWARAEPLVRDTGHADALDALRRRLRRRLSLVAVELGVTLQELGRPAEAYEAYGRALAFDAGNASAKLNRLKLSQAGTQPDGVYEDDARLAGALEEKAPRAFLGQLTQRCGTIRTPEALAGLAQCWMRVGEPGLAVSALQRAADLASDERRDRALEALAALHIGNGETARGEEVCRRLLAANPANGVALLSLAQLAARRGDRAAVSGWTDQARRAGVPGAPFEALAPVLELAAGRPGEAERLLVSLCDRHPKDAGSLGLLATVLVRQGRVGEAERQVLPRLKALGKPAAPAFHKTRSQLARAKGAAFFAAAREDLRTALLYQPGEWPLLADILGLDQLLRDKKAAERDAGALLRRNPDHPAANRALGLLLLARGELEDAEYRLRRSAVAEPGNAEVWNELAETLRRRGSLAAAEEAARKALALRPDSASDWDTLANILLDAGLLPGAREACDRACGLNPRDPRLALTAAYVRARDGRSGEARALLRQFPRKRMPPDEAARYDRLKAELDAPKPAARPSR